MSTTKVVYWGTGRRKTAVARVRLVPGTGTVTINGRPGDNYLNYNPVYLAAVKAPLNTLGLATEYDILVNVRGGGLTGQAGAHHGTPGHVLRANAQQLQLRHERRGGNLHCAAFFFRGTCKLAGDTCDVSVGDHLVGMPCL